MVKKEKTWVKVMLSGTMWLFVYLTFTFAGFILGTAYQQLLTSSLIEKALSNTNVEVNVNFNSTEFTNELNRTFIPAWKIAFNETVNNQLGNKTK